jgi:hypothetical protein
VQVRNVEFYVDAARVFSDASFPFEHRFLTPLLSADRSNFTVRARAVDTGGNFAWSDEITVALTPDMTPPRVTRTSPANNTITNSVETIFTFFNEPIDRDSVTTTNLRLDSAGADFRLGTTDDLVMTNGVISFRDGLNAVVLSFSPPLSFGLYRLVIEQVRDAAGNPITNATSIVFAVLASGPDGDDDGDDLANNNELHLGTSPLVADTDGDGWVDGVEAEEGTDPLNPASKPQAVFVAAPLTEIELPGGETFGGTGIGLIVARPPVEIELPSADALGFFSSGFFVAQPPVEIELPSVDGVGSGASVFLIARPPVEAELPASDSAVGLGLLGALPPVEIELPSFDASGFGLWLAQPQDS